MNVVDSPEWREYFADGPDAPFCARAIEQVDSLVVPSICLFEVGKRVLQQRGENAALEAVAAMRQHQVVDLDAILWTQDADFEDRESVQFRRGRG